jgi:transposase
MANKKLEMDIINPHSGGIDIGSRSHFVATGQALEVKEFGVYADDLIEICEHLKAHDITSVAMESIGSYWQNLYVELVKHGFNVVLANGKFTKNIKGKKTDVKGIFARGIRTHRSSPNTGILIVGSRKMRLLKR